ncbi:MAG: PAS domain-containing protein, partial [Candidatus Binatia bacterium]
MATRSTKKPHKGALYGTSKRSARPRNRKAKQPTNTERKQAEEQLQLTEERLRLAAEGAGLGTWHFNVVSGELIWSERCREIFAAPPEMELNYGLFLEMVHPEDREQAIAETRRALEHEQLCEAEFRAGRAGRWRMI